MCSRGGQMSKSPKGKGEGHHMFYTLSHIPATQAYYLIRLQKLPLNEWSHPDLMKSPRSWNSSVPPVPSCSFVQTVQCTNVETSHACSYSKALYCQSCLVAGGDEQDLPWVLMWQGPYVSPGIDAILGLLEYPWNTHPKRWCHWIILCIVDLSFIWFFYFPSY